MKAGAKTSAAAGARHNEAACQAPETDFARFGSTPADQLRGSVGNRAVNRLLPSRPGASQPGQAPLAAGCILSLQAAIGNRAVNRLLQRSPGRLQRGPQIVLASKVCSAALQRKGEADIKTVGWKAGVEMAEKAAKKTKKKAERYYKELIVRAAGKVAAPAPLKDKKPAASDISWSWKATKYEAAVYPKRVDNFPDNYWKWVTFGPGAVHEDEAFTVSLILHELDHAAHAKALFNEWKKTKKGKWDDFYETHYKKWTEKAIKVTKPGIIGALSGFPDKIRPSAIEFRAYINQFANYFHKVSIEKQGFMAKAIILFHPLKVREVKEKISDPSLNLSKAKEQVLDYFKSPPVKDKGVIKARVASEFKSALLLRLEAYEVLKTEFKPILDYSLSPEQRKEARRKYKPEGL